MLHKVSPIDVFRQSWIFEASFYSVGFRHGNLHHSLVTSSRVIWLVHPAGHEFQVPSWDRRSSQTTHGEMQSVLQMNVYGVDGCGPFSYLLLLPTKSIEFEPAAGLTVVWLLLRLSDAMPSHHRRRSDDDDGFFLACEDFWGRSFSFPVCAYF